MAMLRDCLLTSILLRVWYWRSVWHSRWLEKATRVSANRTLTNTLAAVGALNIVALLQRSSERKRKNAFLFTAFPEKDLFIFSASFSPNNKTKTDTINNPLQQTRLGSPKSRKVERHYKKTKSTMIHAQLGRRKMITEQQRRWHQSWSERVT